MASKFIVIIGPTASGKSDLALRLAQNIGGVIVNSDSQQVYKDLRILSARPTDAEEKLAPHYLYGALPATTICSAGMWKDMVKDVLANEERPKIFCGGTGLYLHGLWNPVAKVPPIPESIKYEVRRMKEGDVAAYFGAEASDNHRRNVRALEVFLATGKHLKQWQAEQPPADFKIDDFLILVMNVPRETLYQKINDRFIWMLENGAMEEVQKLRKMKLDPTLPIMKAHGVPELIKYIEGDISHTEAIERASQNVRNYAKRQLTWIRNQLPHQIEVQDMSYADILGLVEGGV